MRLFFLFSLLLLCRFTPDVKAQTPSRFQVVDNALELPAKINFKPGTAIISNSTAPLEHIRAYLKANPSVTLVRVEGHVAGEATDKLSGQRALAVARWLRMHGVACKRLVVVGFGNTRPVFDRTPPGEASGNTRIDIKIAAVRGQLVDGAPANGGGKPAGNPCR